MAVIINKYAGRCDNCQNRVGKGEGVAKRKAGKWIVLCAKDAGETHGARNPWKPAHKTAALDYAETPYEASRELALVDHEYAHSDEMSEPCECGGTMWYKATVGAPICPDCRRMVVYKWTGVGTEFTRRIVQL
jgi:hypothetical protein